MGTVDLAGLADNSLVQIQDISELKQMRVTGLVRFAECPKRWITEMLGLTDFDADQEGSLASGKNKYARIGTAAHNVVELFLSDRWQSEGDSWEWAVAHCMKMGMPPAERENLQNYLRLLDNGGWRRRAVVTELKLVGSPQPYGLPVGGTLDYIGFNEEDDCWDILDHKTNRQMETVDEWKVKLQPMFYTWLLREYLRENGEADKPIRYSIGYVNYGCILSWITDPTADGVADLYASLWSQFKVYRETNEWPERLNQWCYSCPIMGNCRTAQQSMADLASMAGEMDEREVSLLVKHDFYSCVAKLAMSLLEETKDSIKDQMVQDGKEVLQEVGMSATLKQEQRRKADFWPVWDAVRTAYAGALSEEDQAAIEQAFSVRLGGLDKLVAARPELALQFVDIITSEPNASPTLRVLRLPKGTKK